MNIANLLTVLRLILALIIFYLLILNPFTYAICYAFILFLLAALSDYLDGVYARKKGVVSNFGKLMDPVADKLLIILTLLALSYLGYAGIWMVLLVALREVIMTCFRLYALAKGKVLEAKEAGKYKTFCQMIGVMLIFTIVIFLKYTKLFTDWENSLQMVIDFIMLVIVVVTFYSAVTYIKGLKRVNEKKKTY